MDIVRQACRLSLLSAVMAMAFCRVALATPYVDVRSSWFATSEGVLSSDGTVSTDIPSGVTITCNGSYPIGYGGSCSNGLLVSHLVTYSITESYSSTASLVITNAGDTSLSGSLIFDVTWSAFNPGGPEIGLSIDNTSQSASFSTTSNGPTDNIGGDFHSCSLPVPVSQLGFGGGQFAYNFTTLSCGVPSPDSDDGFLFVDLSTLAPGDSVEFDNTLTISDSFSIPAPEPSGLAILAFAVFCALAVSRLRLAC